MMKKRTRNKPLYGNCLIQAPDGQPLCRTNLEKIEWYLQRGLGKIVSENPTTLQLSFEPQSRNGADHPFSTAYKENICVVCGSDDQITRHHVVPRCFRKHFPIKLKEHALHDVLILCIKCHDKYEDAAYQFKKSIAAKMNLNIAGNGKRTDKYLLGVRNAAHVLVNYYNNLPQARIDELSARLCVYFNKDSLSKEDILSACEIQPLLLDPDYKTFGKCVVERLENINEFVREWRLHFVKTMFPKFMPEHWEIDFTY